MTVSSFSRFFVCVVLSCWSTVLCTSCIESIQEGPICLNGLLHEEHIVNLDDSIRRITLRNISGDLSLSVLSKFKKLRDISIVSSNIDELTGLCSNHDFTKIAFISSTIPPIKNGTFKNCSSVATLYFTFIIDLNLETGGFTGLTNIESLFFDHGNWIHLASGQLTGLNSLKYLAITNSRVREIDKDFFGTVPDLERLSLVGNDINNIDPGTFSSLSKLEDLQLFSNNLNRINGTEFKGLDSLEVLDLIHNPISTINIDILLENLPNLKHIYLTRSNLEDSNRPEVAKKLKAAGLSKLNY